MNKSAKFSLWFLRIAILVALIYDIRIVHFAGIAGGLAVLVMTFVVEWINGKTHILSNQLIVIYCAFCTLALVFGTMLMFYDLISWWDLLMHFFSGVILGFTAIKILGALHPQSIHPFLSFIFIVGFACLGGVVWEIYEFSADILLNLDTQRVLSTGVADTMADLITDFLGGVFVACLYIVQKHQATKSIS